MVVMRLEGVCMCVHAACGRLIERRGARVGLVSVLLVGTDGKAVAERGGRGVDNLTVAMCG
jgi:hypothetical protein